MLGAVVYCALVWAALIEGAPRVVAWLGERTAMASQPKASAPAPKTPDDVGP